MLWLFQGGQVPSQNRCDWGSRGVGETLLGLFRQGTAEVDAGGRLGHRLDQECGLFAEWRSEGANLQWRQRLHLQLERRWGLDSCYVVEGTRRVLEGQLCRLGTRRQGSWPVEVGRRSCLSKGIWCWPYGPNGLAGGCTRYGQQILQGMGSSAQNLKTITMNN